jgi:hypothetical protein
LLSSLNPTASGRQREVEAAPESRRYEAWASAPHVSSASLLERIEMALAKKKRVGKKTVSANQVRKTASGRKRRKSDGTQAPKAVTPGSTPAAS